MDFAQKLNELRKSRGFSQEDLGEKINVTRQTISNWESGLSTPDMDSIIALAKLFEISTDELLAYKHEEPIVHIESKGNNVYGIHFSPFAWHFEYKSKTKVGVIPLVHVNFGFGHHVAKGIFALGNIAFGVFSLGFIGIGLIGFGLLGLGLLAGLGTLGIGFFGFGSIAAGVVSFGAVSVGVISFGAVSCGVYSIGAASVGSQIAYGSQAKAPLAFSTDNGAIEFTKEEIARAIDEKFPELWEFIKNLFVSLGV